MKRRTKRILGGIAAFVVILVGTPVVAIMITLSGDTPIKDGEPLGPRSKQVQDGYVSVGVIDIGGGIALVDCSNDKDAKAIFAELERRKLGADDVKAIFITHGHPDHVNGCAKFPKAEIHALAAEKDIIEGRAGTKGMMPRMMPANDSGVRVKHEMKDGEEVTIGEVKVTAFALPGHTVGSAVYFADGVLYFGDGATASKDGPISPPKYLFSDDQKLGNASLKGLAEKLEPRASEITKLEFAHSGALGGFEPLRAFAKSH